MLSIIVPCYNEEKNIKKLVQAFQPVKDFMGKDGFELILVDNGSEDGTNKEIDDAQKRFGYIKKVTVDKNQGYGYGILQGLKECKGEWMGWLHADLQIHPKTVIEIIKKFDEKEDTLENTFFRGRRKGRPLVDAFFTWGMAIFESIYLHARLYDINAQPTIFNRKLYMKMTNPPYDFSLDLYIYCLARKCHFDVVRIPVLQNARTEGESSWNTGMAARIKLIKRTISYSKNLKKQLSR